MFTHNHRNSHQHGDANHRHHGCHHRHSAYHMQGHHHGKGGRCSHSGDRDGFDGHGRSPMLRGRKFSSDELQLLLVYFLAEHANYGYELIKIFTQRTNGFYTPSPGVIYPALTYLEEIDYVSVQAEGNRKRYALTPLGQQYLADNQAIIDSIIAKLDHIAKRMDSVREAMTSKVPTQPMQPELEKAIHQVRHSLHRCHELSEQQQQQVVAILNSATKAIDEISRESCA